MSNKNKQVDAVASSPTVSWGNGYAVSESTPDRLVGQVFTRLEVLGLQEKQEESLKHIIRQTIWDCFQDGIYLKPETYTELRDRKYEADKLAQSKGFPPGIAI